MTEIKRETDESLWRFWSAKAQELARKCDAMKRDTVTWLHKRADEMNDPHARIVLNSAADDFSRLSRAAIAAMPADRPVAEGWVMVPRVPTNDMCVAGWKEADKRDAILGNGEVAMVYAAMLSAAPAHPADTYAAGWRDRGWNTDTADFAQAVCEFETALPGFWWSVGQCSVGAHASCAVDDKGCQAGLLIGVVAGEPLDSGFHCDTDGGSPAEALRDVMQQAVVYLAALREDADHG